MQSLEIARENAEIAIARHKRHMSISDSARFPLRTDFRRTFDSFELRDFELLNPTHSAEDYEAHLPALKRFFYLETKVMAEQIAALRAGAPGGEHEKSLLGLKSHLVASYQLLDAQETALKVTTLTSLVEFSICTSVSAALGIVVYMEGDNDWTTITSYTLFGLCVFYKIFDCISCLPDAWFDISEADYQRLAMEARNSGVHHRGATSRFFEAD